MVNVDNFRNCISNNTNKFLRLKIESIKNDLSEINSTLENINEQEEGGNLINSINILKLELNRFQLMLNNKKVFYPKEQNEVCKPGNAVILEISKKKKTFHLDTVSVEKNLSIFEPLGYSLIGKKVGDSFSVKNQNKVIEGKILIIQSPSEVMETCFPKVEKQD